MEQPYIQTPHSDATFLHRPGVCTSCDLFPTWQEARVVWKVPFTLDSLPEQQYGLSPVRQLLADNVPGRGQCRNGR